MTKTVPDTRDEFRHQSRVASYSNRRNCSRAERIFPYPERGCVIPEQPQTLTKQKLRNNYQGPLHLISAFFASLRFNCRFHSIVGYRQGAGAVTSTKSQRTAETRRAQSYYFLLFIRRFAKSAPIRVLWQRLRKNKKHGCTGELPVFTPFSAANALRLVGDDTAALRVGCGFAALRDITLRGIVLRSAVLLTVCIGIWNSSAQNAQNTSGPQSASNTPSRFDYSAFRIISDRNIFNPRRSAGYVPSERTTRRSTSRTESFALVGTMNYDAKGPLAFFDGSSADYRKVLKPNDRIAGFTVAAIESSHVKLASATNQVELRVGMQLNHDEKGGWHIGERAENLTRPAPSASSARSFTNRPNFTATNSSPGSTNTLARDAELPPPFADAPFPPDSIQPSEPGTPEPAAPAGNPNDVLEILRRRRAAESGESSQ
jgi:hypothetical protein